MFRPSPTPLRTRHRRKLHACTNCRQQLQPQAGALAHSAEQLSTDLNQILNQLLSVAEVMAEPLDGSHPIGELFNGLLKATLDASQLHRGARSLEQALHPAWMTPIDMTVLVREALRLAETALPQGQTFRSSIGSGIWALGKTGLFKQVLLDLLLSLTQNDLTEGLLVTLEERPSHLDPVKGWDVSPSRHVGLVLQGSLPPTTHRVEDSALTRLRATSDRAMCALSGIAGARVELEGTDRHWQLQVLLPCGLGPPQPAGKEGEQALHGSEHVLLVAQDALTPKLASWGLEPMGYRVTSCTSSAEALEAFRSNPSSFDVVLFDLVLPRMGGIDLAHRLKHLRRDIPLILMTETPLSRSHLLGMHTELRDVLQKPFTIPELASVIRKHADPPTPLLEAPRRETRNSQPTLLLAEDSAVTRGMIRAWLAGEDCCVVDAKDGQAAWELFEHRARSGEAFDLVVTDVVMPRMDGLTLAGKIRAVDADIPIVVMTSVEDRETIKSALTIGVNDFLNKPFEQDVLRTCIQRLLSSTGQRAEARRSVETAQAVRMAQRALLAVPEKDLPLYSLYEPLTDAGGDVFRAFHLSEGRIFFLLGDVAGHSVISSYAVASFLGMLSTFNDSSTDLATLAHRLNQGIQDGPFSEVPVCTLLGIWHSGTGRLQLLNAGIPHGVLYRASIGTAEAIRLNGTPLGILPDPPMDETVLNLHPGDRLLFGTDGFFEVHSSDRQPFEDQVLHQWSLLKESPVQWALSLICESARAHGEGVISDDLLVLGFEQGPLKVPPSEFIRVIQSDASEIDQVIDEFKSFLENSEKGEDFRAERRFEIILVLREALTNAVFHGNQSRAEARITLHARFLGGGSRLHLRVADEGSGFPLDQHQAPTDPASERGRGIPLMRYFAQRVQMTGSELSLIFDPEGPGHDQPNPHVLS